MYNRKSGSKKSMRLISNNSNRNVEIIAKSYKAQQIDELRQIYKMYDKTNKGSINATELKFLLRGFGDNVNQVELMERLEEMDQDKNGTIEFQQFVDYMMDKVNNQTLIGDLTQIFRVFDVYGLGTITSNQLRIITQGKVDTEIIDNLMKIAEADESGDIHYSQFFKSLLP